MVVWNLIFSTILLPLVGIAVLARRPRQPIAGWIATLILSAGVVGFAVLAAPWAWFGVPLRFLIIALFLVALVVSLRRKREADPIATPTNPMRLVIMVIVGLFFGTVAIGVLRAHRVPFKTLDVAFPMTDGTYLVVHGGSEPAANMHAHDAIQRYGIDLVQLNRAGMRATGIYPSDLTRYEIFGRPVGSPCDGKVVSVVDGQVDSARPSPDNKVPLGNQVIVRCGDTNVTLAHLQRGSIMARPGMVVFRGTPLARVGSSGISTEPQLHIHADRDGVAVPLRLDGRWLVRNAIIRK